MKTLSGGGIEYGIDGAVIDGIFYLILVREKILTSYPYTQCIGYFSINEIKNKDKIYDSLQKSINVLKINNCLFHADLIIDKNKEPFIIEISPRPSGHNLHNHFTILSTGVDMLEEYLNYVLNKPYNFLPKQNKNLLMRFFDFENCQITKIPPFEKIKEKYNILDFKCNINNEKLLVVKDGHSIIDRGYFIIENKSKNNLIKYADEILNMFEKTN